MYKNHLVLLSELKDYASPRAKITRMLDTGEMIQVRRGIYLPKNEKNFSRKALASVIYGPSYISFESALEYYGMIPERVAAITSAIYKKNKNKDFSTPVGRYLYYYLPSKVYPYSVCLKEEQNESFLIASPEKALCDTIYRVGKIATVEDLKELLYENLRIEMSDLAGLNPEKLLFLIPLYKKQSLRFLRKFLLKEIFNE
jgi:predicted transcriptional regulator of viral defense system